jgi:7-carboxy-7-deazaguanine synthase
MDDCLVSEFHRRGFEVAVETDGSILPPAGIDWICVSPKAGAKLVLCKGNELKLVVPQAELDPKKSVNLEFDNFFLESMDRPQKEQTTYFAVHYCWRCPHWRLSVQTHKFIGIR